MKPTIRISLVLITLTSLIFACATPKKEAEPEFTEPPQEATRPIHFSPEAFPLKDGAIVHLFPKSPREQIRVTVGKIDGETFFDIRIFNRMAQFDFVPTEEGLTIPADLLPELQIAVDKLQDTLAQSR